MVSWGDTNHENFQGHVKAKNCLYQRLQYACQRPEDKAGPLRMLKHPVMSSPVTVTHSLTAGESETRRKQNGRLVDRKQSKQF